MTQKKVQGTIKGRKFDLDGDNRAIIEYEAITGKGYDDIKTHTENMQFVYCMLLSSARKQNFEFKMSFDEFIDYVDANPDWRPKFENPETDSGEKKE